MILPLDEANFTLAMKEAYKYENFCQSTMMWIPLERSPYNSSLWISNFHKNGPTYEQSALPWKRGEPNGHLIKENCLGTSLEK